MTNQDCNNIKELANQINFERRIEKIMINTKTIYDIAIKVGFDEEDAFDFANQYYRWFLKLD